VTGITEYVLTPHAEFEMQRRGIGKEVVQQLLSVPEQTIDVRPGRVVLQSRATQEGKVYLVRVFVDVDRRPAEVITVYRTSKVSKYWRGSR
jgi:Domain of unknown function (DUF4258)